jgi:hypothetical protein
MWHYGKYCDMRSDRYNSGARETAIARQWPCKQATVPEPSLGSESASDNGRTIGGSVFYAVCAEAIVEGCLDKPSQFAVREYEVGMRWSPACEDVGLDAEGSLPLEAM